MIPKILMAMLVVGSVALSACESVDGDTDLSVEEEQSALLNAIGSPCEGCALPSFMPRLCPDGSLVAPSAECVWGEDQTCETKITPAPACPLPVVGEGELCVGIAGPVATCAEGLECVNLGPDNSVCQTSNVVCAMDTMLCLDGSEVSRDPENNCEFRPCDMCPMMRCASGYVCKNSTCNLIGSPCEGCALPMFMPRVCPDGSVVAPSAECVWGEDQTCETKITPAPACPMPVVGEGELCVGFAGPVATCEEGLECVNLSPDNSVCLEVVVLNAKDDNNKWRHVTVGNYIEVRLPQSTNGSEWEAITRLHNLKNIEYVTDYFEENAKDPTNNPGTHIFGFRAVSAGKTTVRFRNASKSFTLKLRITR